MRVLVVEDEKVMAAGLRAGLEAEGFAVDVAGDGIDGVWLAREKPYDAIVLDLMLPAWMGTRCAGSCGGARSGRQILVLTARDDERAVVGALDLGADDYLTKPSRPSEQPGCAEHSIAEARP